jgi:hypothetical protein
MLTLVLVKPNKFTVLFVQASILTWTYLRCDWWLVDKSMRVIIHICCQTQGRISRLRYVKSGPGQMQYNYNSSYSVCNIQLNINPPILVIWRPSNARYTPHLRPNTGHISLFALRQPDDSIKLNVITDLHIEASVINWTYFRCNCRYGDNSMLAILHLSSQMQPKSSGSCYVTSGPSQIQYNYSSSYGGFNFQLNVSPLRMVVYRQIDIYYTPHLQPHRAHNNRITQCQFWSPLNPI